MFAGCQNVSLCGYNPNRTKVITTEPMFFPEPSQAAAKREARNTCGRNHSPGSCQPIKLRFPVNISPDCPSLYNSRFLVRIYMNTPHIRKVNDESVVNQSQSCHIMAATANRYLQLIFPRKVNGKNYIGCSPAFDDKCRVFVNEPVPNLPFIIIHVIFRCYNISKKCIA